VSVLPRMSALICIFAFLFGHVRGLSTWMFYRWRMGMESPVACGVLVSVAIVILAFPSARRLRHNRRTGAVQAGPDPGPEGLRCWQTGC
jgi:integral membrane sensor domain MASE1